jgi:DNA phosphorothioation-associated putative methyltransferase
MLTTKKHFDQIIFTCKNSPIGKLLPNAIYIHQSALENLDPLLQKYEKNARKLTEESQQATLIKFSFDRPKISYLFYPNFDQDPHPVLEKSIVIDLKTLEINQWDYQTAENPPILHRKETFINPDYPRYEEFAQLTRYEVALGLLNNSRYIGNKLEWEERLEHYGIGFQDHYLICFLDKKPDEYNQHLKLKIERHKAAIIRKELSRPVRLALEAELFTPGTTFFDYGCGYGGDIERIEKQGYHSTGWDPYYRPHTQLKTADIVNLGYVINVIEDPEERREALIAAWRLTKNILIVAAQVLIDDRNRGIVAYGDGVITRRNTFQKYYEQEELKIYIDQVLNVDSIPIGLGIYVIFKQEEQAQQFKASRFQSRTNTPKIYRKIRLFEDYEVMLQPLMQFITERGRLPIKKELDNALEILEEFGNFKRAYNLILEVTQQEEWEEIMEKRSQELLLYLALSKIENNRPTYRQLPSIIKEDIKALLGDYKQGCLLADMMLFSLRDQQQLAELCQTSTIGKKLKNGLLIHISVLDQLDPLLRLYEGCASRTIGRLEDANVIKFYAKEPKISYLYYPYFDQDPHPILKTSMQINLTDLRVNYRDYDVEDNPPILHEKDRLVMPDYPLYEQFAKLTHQEETWGLLDDFKAISRLKGWLSCLEEHCAMIKGHRLQWRKDADPYKVKLLKSKMRSKKISSEV